MRLAAAVLVVGMMPLPAAAQAAVDWCGSPLASQADPNTALLWRLRCTIQILDRERAEAADHVTTVEVDKAITEAHLKAIEAELDAAKKGPPTPTILPEKKDK